MICFYVALIFYFIRRFLWFNQLFKFNSYQQHPTMEQSKSRGLQIAFKTRQTVENLQKPGKMSTNQGIEKVRLKNKMRKIIIGLIISLSAVMFGYSVKEITSVPIKKLISQYGITIDSFVAQSILIGILPIGSIFGAIITHFMIKRYKRLTGIYVFTLVNIGAVVLINITTFQTLIAGRFIQGICIGYYSAIAPVYLKQIAPKELRTMLGLFFSLGKIIGVLFVIIIELIFEDVHLEIGWRIILSMTAGFSILQAILIFLFGSDTPAEMIEKGDDARALEIIKHFYFEQYVEQVFNQYKKEFEMEVNKGKENLSEDLNAEKRKHKSKKMNHHQEVHHLQIVNATETHHLETIKQFYSEPSVAQTSDNLQQIGQKLNQPTFQQKKSYAYWLGIHLCVIRHWTAGNTIISQGGQFIKIFDPLLGNYTPLIINLIQFVFVIIGLTWIKKLVGKRPLFLFSIGTLSLINLGLAVAMIGKNVEAMEMIMCAYMVIYGGFFICPIWAYPSQIVPVSQSLAPNIFHWLALALALLIPPIISGQMPDNNPYPVFLFFGIYGLLALIHVFKTLRESDGRTYDEIIASFK